MSGTRRPARGAEEAVGTPCPSLGGLREGSREGSVNRPPVERPAGPRVTCAARASPAALTLPHGSPVYDGGARGSPRRGRHVHGNCLTAIIVRRDVVDSERGRSPRVASGSGLAVAWGGWDSARPWLTQCD